MCLGATTADKCKCRTESVPRDLQNELPLVKRRGFVWVVTRDMPSHIFLRRFASAVDHIGLCYQVVIIRAVSIEYYLSNVIWMAGCCIGEDRVHFNHDRYEFKAGLRVHVQYALAFQFAAHIYPI